MDEKIDFQTTPDRALREMELSQGAGSTEWVSQLIPGVENFSGGGLCPVQTFGTIHRYPFYFRERGGVARLRVAEVGTDPVDPKHTLWQAAMEVPEAATDYWFDHFCQLVEALDPAKLFPYDLVIVDPQTEAEKALSQRQFNRIWAESPQDILDRMTDARVQPAYVEPDEDHEAIRELWIELIKAGRVRSEHSREMTEAEQQQWRASRGPKPDELLEQYFWDQAPPVFDQLELKEADTRIWPEPAPTFVVDAPDSWRATGSLVTPWAPSEQELREALWWDAVCEDARVFNSELSKQYRQRHPDLDPGVVPKALVQIYGMLLAARDTSRTEWEDTSALDADEDGAWLREQIQAYLESTQARHQAILDGTADA